MASAICPSCRILLVEAAQPYLTDLGTAVNTAVRMGAKYVSNSYGGAETSDTPSLDAAYFDHPGVAITASSGDDGYRTEYPAASRFVTAVGGTSLAIGKKWNYLFETGWGTERSTFENGAWTPTPPGDFWAGGGGGTSRVFPEPWYQKPVVPRSLSHYFGANGIPTGGRVVPDVAMVGDPYTGMEIGFTQTFPNGVYYSEYSIGGTSLSVPLFAGVMAIADQKAGMRHGFANPALYRIAGTSAYHDIVNPPHPVAVVARSYANGLNAAGGYHVRLASFNRTGTLHTRPGYDDVTGMGTPRGAAFFERLNAAG
jgi:subtilase family serine protease